MTDTCAACGLDVYDGGQLCPICRADPPPGFAPNGENPRVESSTDSGWTDLQHAAMKAIAAHGGVMKAARALGCNHGVISLAAKGEDFPKARRVLGLPPKAIEVRPCPSCGKVHEQLHTCDEQRQRNKRTKANGWHRRAVWIHESELPRFDAWLQGQGCDSLQELVDREVQESG